MLPEIGHFCLILALSLGVLQCLAFAFITFKPTHKLTLLGSHMIRGLALGQALFVMLGFLLLECCFVLDDFSVAYVAQNSNSLLPTYYKFTALWGAHEGSLLLWITILSVWILAVTIVSRDWQLNFSAQVLAVMGLVNLGFLILLLFYSNPFLRIFDNIPLDGADLNPLLQDIGMISHPPILYMGYVGSTIAFAFAIAALLQAKISADWARLLRPWVLLTWMFLTLGITIGSWWAYYELGWGGWWFWDPVENASFMPWLTATALLHCLVVAAKHGKLLLLAIFLAIVTFALSLLGTFIVRSGVITSVHAFASDPKRGVYILMFLAFIVGGALLLYGSRATTIKKLYPQDKLSTKEILIVTNNILLLLAASAILLGTMLPVIYESIYGVGIAVGYQYFNAVFLPIMSVLCLALLPAIQKNTKALLSALVFSLLLAILFLNVWFNKFYILSCMGLTFALAIICNTLLVIYARGFKHMAMHLAHLGFAITIIGVSITPMYEIEKELSLKLGDTITIANYKIQFAAISVSEGVNYISNVGKFVINEPNGTKSILYPEKRLYLAQEMPMSETAILPGVFQDIYIALGQQLDDHVWSMQIFYKPFVRWIWSGAILMVIGALYGFVRRKKYVK